MFKYEPIGLDFLSSEEKLMKIHIQSLKSACNGKIFIVLRNGHIYRFENFNQLVNGIVEKSTILSFELTKFEVTKHYAYVHSKKSKLHILDINTLEILKTINDIQSLDLFLIFEILKKLDVFKIYRRYKK